MKVHPAQHHVQLCVTPPRHSQLHRWAGLQAKQIKLSKWNKFLWSGDKHHITTEATHSYCRDVFRTAGKLGQITNQLRAGEKGSRRQLCEVKWENGGRKLEATGRKWSSGKVKYEGSRAKCLSNGFAQVNEETTEDDLKAAPTFSSILLAAVI